MAVHQFSPSIGLGDGVSNGIFFTRTLLRAAGIESEIFADLIPSELQDQVFPRAEKQWSEHDVILFHHSLGYPDSDWLARNPAKKILIYHNITPAEFLPPNGLPELSRLGMQQLAQWRELFVAAIGDSELNCVDLQQLNYPNVQALPLLVDHTKWQHLGVDVELENRLQGAHTILFVGRISSHKHQRELIALLPHIQARVGEPVRLVLAGGVTSEPYLHDVLQEIQKLGLQEHVMLLGKVSEAQLHTLYRNASIYLSLSEHEGFGMPLIEAMLNNLPVIARRTPGVQETMGQGGLLLDETLSPEGIAKVVSQVLRDRVLRRKIVGSQRENIQRFERAQIQNRLYQLLIELGIETTALNGKIAANNANPATGELAQASKKVRTLQIEGPFDSSYSLAVVNRELAHALHTRVATTDSVSYSIYLRSREGAGDFPVSEQFHHDCPELSQRLVETTIHGQLPDIVMRNCYPPTIADMPAQLKVLHSYGWEETTVPQEFVTAWNRNLDLIICVSRFVAKALRDSGVRVPLAVAGNGVNHTTKLSFANSENSDTIPSSKTWKKFKFLHVSSCFPRKGVDILLAAWGEAFSLADEVSLIIKTFPNPHNQVRQQLAALRASNPRFPHVDIIDDDFDDSKMQSLYQHADVLVLPSRGEGFGLPAGEAMLLGKPVITTAWSGVLDFCNNENAWLIDYDFEPSQSHFSYTHSAWAAPRKDHLIQRMQEVYRATPADIQAKTKVAQETISTKHTWDAVAQRTIQAIEAIDRNDKPWKEAKIGWVSSWNSRCGIAAYSAWLTQAIPAHRLQILASHVADRTERDAPNVVRSWTSDRDDTLEYLWMDICDHAIEVLVIQFNFGFYDLNKLRELLIKAKQNEIDVYLFFHSTADVETPDFKASLRTIVTELRQVKRLFVHGINDLNRFKSFGLIDNVCYFPQGIVPQEGQSYRIPAHSGQSIKTIAAYGFLLPHKGLQQLIDAFILLASDNPNYQLLLVNAIYPVFTSQHEYRLCYEKVLQAGLQDRVRFITDYLSDEESLSHLASADLIVYPYQQTQESSSAAVRMGIASGRPVAVTPLSIFADVSDAVVQLPGCTPPEIAQGILELFAQPERLLAAVQQSETWKKERYWPVLSRRLLNLIDGEVNQPLTHDG